MEGTVAQPHVHLFGTLAAVSGRQGYKHLEEQNVRDEENGEKLLPVEFQDRHGSGVISLCQEFLHSRNLNKLFLLLLPASHLLPARTSCLVFQLLAAQGWLGPRENHCHLDVANFLLFFKFYFLLKYCYHFYPLVC